VTDLHSRIDAWLDADQLLDPGAVGHPDDSGWLVEVVTRGRRRRARRRASTAAICGAAALVALAVTVPLTGVLTSAPRTTLPADQGPGPASWTTSASIPAPRAASPTSASPTSASQVPASTTPTIDAPSTPPSGSRSAPSRPRGSGGRVTVYYPDGAGGTRAVTWPAPGSGLPWAVDAPSVAMYGTAAPATAGARELRDALLATVPGRFVAATSWESAEVTGLVGGRPTAYRVSIEAGPRISTSSARTQPASYSVSMTRGGLAKWADVFDYCGSWPDDFTGLGNQVGLSYTPAFEFNQPPRCTVLVRPDGRTVIHLVAQQGKPSEVPPTPLQAISFGVRPDGTAVSARTLAPLDAGWSAAQVAATLDRLDRLVETFPYPSQP
jgi:hypothetical protein